MRHLKNIFNLGLKEFMGLWRDKVMFALLIYAFTFGIYVGAVSLSSELRNAPVAFIDEDRSELSARIIDSFYGPYFTKPELIDIAQADKGLDSGIYTFVVDIPPDFEKDIMRGQKPSLQLNIDATRMTQAGVGSGYVQNIIVKEINAFVHPSQTAELPIDIVTRVKYNANLESSWFGGVMEMVNNIAMFSILLTGAAFIREREHGTLEHLLVMPLNAFEVMMAKIWSMGLVVLIMSSLSLQIILKGIIGVPVQGSMALFMCGSALLLFSTTSMGIFLGTISRTMPQLGLLFILTILPMEVLSGGFTAFDSMPLTVQRIMMVAPTPHFVALAQGIIFRGAGLAEVWHNMVVMFVIGLVFFSLSLILFRKSLSSS
ncbi:MAG: ABC transporter permease [Deferribacterales bacterium]